MLNQNDAFPFWSQINNMRFGRYFFYFCANFSSTHTEHGNKYTTTFIIISNISQGEIGLNSNCNIKSTGNIFIALLVCLDFLSNTFKFDAYEQD